MLPPHILLASLHRRLTLTMSQQAGAHYEGLAQAARDAKSVIGGSLAGKLRMVDEAAHLLRHLSPESCAICCSDLCAMLACYTEDGGDSASPRSSLCSAEESSTHV